MSQSQNHGLRIIRSNEPIVAWRRGSWQSMPHLIKETLSDGTIVSRCGWNVSLGCGVNSIIQTQIPAAMFIGVGCGLCRMAIVRDLRDELLAATPDMKKTLRNLLRSLDWKS